MELIKKHVTPKLGDFVITNDDFFKETYDIIQNKTKYKFIKLLQYLDRLFNIYVGTKKNELNIEEKILLSVVKKVTLPD